MRGENNFLKQKLNNWATRLYSIVRKGKQRKSIVKDLTGAKLCADVSPG